MSSIRDVLIVSVLLFAVGLTIFLVVSMSHRVNNSLLVNPSFNNSIPATTTLTHADTAINSEDYMFLMLFVGFFISIAVTGYLIAGYPIMAPIYFFAVIILVFVAIVLQISFSSAVANSEITATRVDLPITYFIISHLGLFTAIMAFVGIIALYAKPPDGGGF